MPDIPANKMTKAKLENGSILGTFSGAIEKPGDHDWIRVELSPDPHNIYLCFLDTGSLTSGDSYLRLYDADGNLVAENDDGGSAFNSFLQYTPATAGTYFIDVSEAGGTATGTYSLFKALPIGTTNAILGSGDDVYTGAANERILGGKGNDVISISAGRDALGEQGNDNVTGNDSTNFISGGLGDDYLNGLGQLDFLFGDAGNDHLFGGDGGDILRGGAGDDDLHGELFPDTLIGGRDKDALEGGTSSDTFKFESIADSRKGATRDVILDFSQTENDTIDLSTIDAKKGVNGNQKFKWIGKSGFHDAKGELHYKLQGDHLLVEGDINGDGRADFQIELSGIVTLSKGDFIL
jgi:Ca2+-binding RTX toxin-like protein